MKPTTVHAQTRQATARPETEESASCGLAGRLVTSEGFRDGGGVPRAGAVGGEVTSARLRVLAGAGAFARFEGASDLAAAGAGA